MRERRVGGGGGGGGGVGGDGGGGGAPPTACGPAAFPDGRSAACRNLYCPRDRRAAIREQFTRADRRCGPAHALAWSVSALDGELRRRRAGGSGADCVRDDVGARNDDSRTRNAGRRMAAARSANHASRRRQAADYR